MRSVVALGFDSFDSVFATRAARHGHAFVLQADGASATAVKIGAARFRGEPGGLGPEKCSCWTCAQHSAGLLHHLFKAKRELFCVECFLLLFCLARRTTPVWARC